MVEAGDAAPSFALEAAVSGTKVTQANGRTTVLVLHGPRTTDAPKEVGKAVRAQHGDAATVFVANVINLQSMGGLWKKVATAQVNQNYQRMAEKLAAKGSDPEAYVVLCCDWDNDVARSFGIEDSNQEAAAVVLDAEGTIKGMATGDDLPGQVLALL